MQELFSQNGSIMIPPTLSITERNGKDSLTIDIYHVPDGYLYGLRAILPPRCYQYQPHPDDQPLATDIDAKQKARLTFLNWCQQNDLKKRGVFFPAALTSWNCFPYEEGA